MTDDEKKKVLEFIDGLFKDDPSIPLSQQRKNIEEFMLMIIDKIGSIESDYNQSVYNINGKVRDIEHLIEFSTVAEKEDLPIDSFVEQSNIPQDLQGLSSEEYLKKLSSTLQYRRRKKDMHAILKAFRENLITTRRFITNMDNRIYTLRTGDDVVDEIDESKISDAIATAATVNPKYQPKYDNGDTPQLKIALPRNNNFQYKSNNTMNMNTKQRKDVK